MNTYELNMDGLVGPTHNYAGLALGNMASTHNALNPSNPQQAALQGIEKMRFLFRLGLKQGVLPPHQRPNLHLLRQLGFTGTIEEQIKAAYHTAPILLSASYSASSMWAANAATVAPSSDTFNQKLHFTPANLVSNLHRHQEANFTQKILEFIFADPTYFVHHPLLPLSGITGDEGAANHNRLCQTHAKPGVHLFVYGKQALGNYDNHHIPNKYPARHTKEACEAIIRNHNFHSDQVVLAQQNPAAIDEGVFHNDVISVANEHVFLVHEQAFLNQEMIFDELRQKTTFPLNIIEIPQTQITMNDVISSYLFNSQILSLNSNNMLLLAPGECEFNPKIKSCIEELIQNSDNPINSVHYMDLRQSMRNGGGPACLRLRIPITEQELQAMHQGVLINDTLLDQLEQWVVKHYRTELNVTDLIDPHLIQETFYALDELTHILKLGPIYPFQVE